MTNNATQSRRMYKAKFDKLGVEAHVVCPLAMFCVRYGPLTADAGRDRGVRVRGGGVHLVCAAAAQGEEGVRGGDDRNRGGTA